MRHITQGIRIIAMVTAVIISAHMSMAQYTVTKVVGQVTNKSTGEKLIPGSKLKDDDLLLFSSDKDVVRVIVSGKGIYIISPTPHKASDPNMIVEMLKSTLKIKSREGYLSGRSEETALVPSALETEASVNNRVLITPSSKFLFDRSTYSVEHGNRFFVQLEFEDASPEIHPLQTNGDTLIINPSDLKPRNKSAVNPRFKVGYYSKNENSSKSLAVLRPYIDTTGEMEAVVAVIVQDQPGADIEKLKQLCYAEVYESMGKPSMIEFDRVFDRLVAEYTKKQ